MKVLIIPEDFRKDQYILKPIIEAMFKHLEKRNTRIKVCQDPLLGGIDQARNRKRIKEIIFRYQGMVDLFLLIIDRDGISERKSGLNALETYASKILPPGKLFFAENAWQEVEVWVLAGHDLPTEWIWQEVRNEVNPKEVYYLPFIKERGLIEELYEGRKTLAFEAAKKYNRIRQLCPEDVAALENRIKNVFGT